MQGPKPQQPKPKPEPENSAEKAARERLAVLSPLLGKSQQRIRDNMSEDCATVLGASSVESAMERTKMSVGFASLGALRYQSGAATKDSGPVARYAPGLFGIGRAIGLNTAINWEDPTKQVAFVDGKIQSFDLLAAQAKQLEIDSMTADQFLDLSLLHELRHSFGGDHGRNLSTEDFDKQIWEKCLK